jgi:hypothetical protein
MFHSSYLLNTDNESAALIKISFILTLGEQEDTFNASTPPPQSAFWGINTDLWFQQPFEIYM